MLAVLQILIGGGLLLAGRRLFWLLVGGIGFAIGVLVGIRLIHRSDLTMVMAALAVGIAFALLALFVEWIAIALAGFVGGGLVGANLPDLLGFHGNFVSLAGFLVGAILGVILVKFLFDWGLIAISALAGSSMIVSGLEPSPKVGALLFSGLLILGLLVQGFGLRSSRSAPGDRSEKSA